MFKIKNAFIKVIFMIMIVTILTACNDDKSIDNRDMNNNQDESNKNEIIQSVYEKDIITQEEIGTDMKSGEQKKDDNEQISKVISKKNNIDEDLTKLQGSMLYSQVYSISYYDYEKYLGKIIRIKGKYASEESSVYEGVTYHFCTVDDPSACCSAGIEFKLNNSNDYPSNIGDIFTITGEFKTYLEDGNMYYYIDAYEIVK